MNQLNSPGGQILILLILLLGSAGCYVAKVPNAGMAVLILGFLLIMRFDPAAAKVLTQFVPGPAGQIAGELVKAETATTQTTAVPPGAAIALLAPDASAVLNEAEKAAYAAIVAKVQAAQK